MDVGHDPCRIGNAMSVRIGMVERAKMYSRMEMCSTCRMCSRMGVECAVDWEYMQ